MLQSTNSMNNLSHYTMTSQAPAKYQITEGLHKAMAYFTHFPLLQELPGIVTFYCLATEFFLGQKKNKHPWKQNVQSEY